MCLTDPSNDQLVKDEGAQIFYSIWSQTKPIGIGANCENPSQCGSNDSKLWPSSDTTCRTVCLTDPSNDQLVKDERARIFYSIRSQTKPIGIGVNCEIPHNAAPTTRTYNLGSNTTSKGDKHLEKLPWVINITYRDTIKSKRPKPNGYVLNYVILTTHSSHLYSMWYFTHTCNPTPCFLGNFRGWYFLEFLIGHPSKQSIQGLTIEICHYDCCIIPIHQCFLWLNPANFNNLPYLFT